MTPVTVSPGDTQPTGMSEGARIAGVFFEPKKAFADIAARPRWIVPLLLLMLASFGIAMFYNQKGVMRLSTEQQMSKNPQIAQLPPDQRAAAYERGMKIASIIMYCIPILIPIVYLIISLVLWGVAAGILSAPLRFGQMFAIVTYAQLPGLLMTGLIAASVAMKKDISDFNVQNPLMFNPGAFMDQTTAPKFIYSLASSLDLFSFWIIFLLATGIKAAAGKKISFGGALFAVILPWAVFVLGRAALSGLGS
jgi:hypothetical protein